MSTLATIPASCQPVRVSLGSVVVGLTLPTAMSEHADIQSRCVSVLAALCGGCTISNGAGAYVMQSTGETVVEPHTRVWAYVPADADLSAVNAAVSELAQYALSHSEEECILCEDTSGAWLAFRPDMGVTA